MLFWEILGVFLQTYSDDICKNTLIFSLVSCAIYCLRWTKTSTIWTWLTLNIYESDYTWAVANLIGLHEFDLISENRFGCLSTAKEGQYLVKQNMAKITEVWFKLLRKKKKFGACAVNFWTWGDLLLNATKNAAQLHINN